MIYLTKGQLLQDNPRMVVYDPTGYYDDGTTINCAMIDAPEEPVCKYEAKFVAYGTIVYGNVDADKLMEEVIKMDPNSLFGKDSQQVAMDNIVENIVPQESVEIVSEPVTNEQPTTEEVVLPKVTPIEQTSSFATIPESINALPPVEGSVIESIVTSSQEVIEEINKISSTVEKIVDVGTNLTN